MTVGTTRTWLRTPTRPSARGYPRNAGPGRHRPRPPPRDRHVRARSRRCACARARRRRYPPRRVPIGLPYLTTRPPARNRAAARPCARAESLPPRRTVARAERAARAPGRAVRAPSPRCRRALMTSTAFTGSRRSRASPPSTAISCPVTNVARVRREIDRRAHQLLDAPEAPHRRPRQKFLAARALSGSRRFKSVSKTPGAIAFTVSRGAPTRPRAPASARRPPPCSPCTPRPPAARRYEASDAMPIRRPEPRAIIGGANDLIGAEHAGQVGVENLAPVGLGHLERRRRAWSMPAAATTMSTRLETRARHASRRRAQRPRGRRRRPDGAACAVPRASIAAATSVHGVAPPAGGDDVSAGVGQAERERAADAGRAADDHRRPSGEVEEARSSRGPLRPPSRGAARLT